MLSNWVNLYRYRTDKRAVLDLSVGEAVITSLALSHDANVAYVANAHGQLNSVDLRKGALFAKYKVGLSFSLFLFLSLSFSSTVHVQVAFS